MMNDKFRFILLYGGIFWGCGFTILMLLYRYFFLNQPSLPITAFGIYFSICFVAGLVWGSLVHHDIQKKIVS